MIWLVFACQFTESGDSMFKDNFSCSAIGNQVNEDYVAVGSTYAVLLDGASASPVRVCCRIILVRCSVVQSFCGRPHL